MTKKTKLEKLCNSYKESLKEFGSKYTELKNSNKKRRSDLKTSNVYDIIIEHIVQMQDIINTASNTIISSISYIEFLEKKSNTSFTVQDSRKQN